MIHAKITEVRESAAEPNVIWIHCVERRNLDREPKTEWVRLPKNETTVRIEFGDTVWTHEDVVYWTPAISDDTPDHPWRSGEEFDIPIERLRGPHQPSRPPQCTPIHRDSGNGYWMALIAVLSALIASDLMRYFFG